MRFLLYNVAYGTGGPRNRTHHVLKAFRYLYNHRRHALAIRDEIEALRPDLVGLVEVDRGCFRNAGFDHVAAIAHALAHHAVFECKYGRESVYRYLPILRMQGNAVLSATPPARSCHHFFPVGAKRLIVEVEVDGLCLFLVHLALSERIRRRQLQVLADIVGRCRKPVLVAGDFNAFAGAHELEALTKATGLHSANRRGVPTYPSYGPRHQLDFILVGNGVRVENFQVCREVRHSDHLPLVADLACPAAPTPLQAPPAP